MLHVSTFHSPVRLAVDSKYKECHDKCDSEHSPVRSYMKLSEGSCTEKYDVSRFYWPLKFESLRLNAEMKKSPLLLSFMLSYYLLVCLLFVLIQA